MHHERKCFLCGAACPLENHHVFGGSNRKKSDRFGLTVKLDHFCHNEPPVGVHHNAETALYLKETAQRAAMEYYGWDVDTFRQMFGKNYLKQKIDTKKKEKKL